MIRLKKFQKSDIKYTRTSKLVFAIFKIPKAKSRKLLLAKTLWGPNFITRYL